MNSPSCSIVGLRNTGAVSRMKSFQNCPGTSGSSGGGESRIVRSSNPCASSVPAKLSSTMNATRCPRCRSTSPMPTQLFVGPYAPSGKKTIVLTGRDATGPALAAAREHRAAGGAEARHARTRAVQAAQAGGDSHRAGGRARLVEQDQPAGELPSPQTGAVTVPATGGRPKLDLVAGPEVLRRADRVSERVSAGVDQQRAGELVPLLGA